MLAASSPAPMGRSGLAWLRLARSLTLAIGALSASSAEAAPYQDPRGFSIDVPPGFKVMAQGQDTDPWGIVAVGNPAVHGTAVVYWFVLSAIPSDYAPVFDRALRQVAQGFTDVQGAGVSVSSKLLMEGSTCRRPFVGIEDFTLKREGRPMRARATVFSTGHLATFYATVAPVDRSASDAATLMGILKSFHLAQDKGSSASPAAPATRGSRPPPLHYVRFTDPTEGAWSFDVPKGWKVQGGVSRPAAGAFFSKSYASAPDGSGLMFTTQPWPAAFTTQPTMDRRYTAMPYPGPRGFIERVVPRLDSQDFAGLQVTGGQAVPDLSVPQQQEAYLANVTMGAKQGQAMAITHVAGTLWMVDFSIWLATPETAEQVHEAWLQAEKTFRYSPQFLARNQASIQSGVAQNEAVVRSVAAASNAVQAGFEQSRAARQEQQANYERTQEETQRGWSNHFNNETTVIDPSNPYVSYQVRAGYDAYYSDGYTIVGTNSSSAPSGPNWTLMEQK